MSTGAPLVLLYPGAGSGSDQPGLVAIAEAVAPVECLRRDFDYRTRGRRAPDRAPKLMAEVRAELDRHGDRPVVLGGRSMGGRIGSMVVAGADGRPPPPQVVGLVLIAYPLHPPGRPDRLRVEHLPDIAVPCLFVSGTRDPFASPDELATWTATIPASVTHVWIDGGRHELRGADAEVAAEVATAVSRFVAPSSGGGRRRG